MEATQMLNNQIFDASAPDLKQIKEEEVENCKANKINCLLS